MQQPTFGDQGSPRRNVLQDPLVQVRQQAFCSGHTAKATSVGFFFSSSRGCSSRLPVWLSDCHVILLPALLCHAVLKLAIASIGLSSPPLPIFQDLPVTFRTRVPTTRSSRSRSRRLPSCELRPTLQADRQLYYRIRALPKCIQIEVTFGRPQATVRQRRVFHMGTLQEKKWV